MGSELKILAILHTFCQRSILPNLEDWSKTCSATFLSKGKNCISNHNLAGYTIYVTSIPMATLQQTWKSISSPMSQEFTDYEKNPS